jgi:hypothetical protein
MDTCRTQCLIEQIVQSAAEFSFDGVWATRGLFDVDGHNDAVQRPASRRRKPVREHADHVGSCLLPEKGTEALTPMKSGHCHCDEGQPGRAEARLASRSASIASNVIQIGRSPLSQAHKAAESPP